MADVDQKEREGGQGRSVVPIFIRRGTKKTNYIVMWYTNRPVTGEPLAQTRPESSPDRAYPRWRHDVFLEENAIFSLLSCLFLSPGRCVCAGRCVCVCVLFLDLGRVIKGGKRQEKEIKNRESEKTFDLLPCLFTYGDSSKLTEREGLGIKRNDFRL